MTDLEAREYQPPEHYEVEMGEQMRVEYPNKVTTGGIATCHAVGIINSQKKIGYLGHFLSEDGRSVEALLNQAISEATGAQDLVVGLAGNKPQSQEVVDSYGGNLQESMNDCSKYGRWLLALLKRNGIETTKIQNALSNNPDDDSYEMEVDTETGKITIKKEEFEDDF